MIYKNFIICFSLMVFFFSCKNKNEPVVDVSNQEVNDLQENQFPVIVDTMQSVVSKQDNYKDVPDARYEPFYFGKLADSIIIGKSHRNFPLPPDIGGCEFEEFSNPYSDYFISFAKSLSDIHNLMEGDSSNSVEILVDNKSLVKECYPVFFTNTSEHIIILGDDLAGVDMVMQGLNEDGVWQNIQERFDVMCGNGISAMILPPSESVVLLAPIYKGPFITQLRLKWNDFYSKPFMGTVNKNQFVISN